MLAVLTQKMNVLADGITKFSHRPYNVCFDNTAGLERFFLYEY